MRLIPARQKPNSYSTYILSFIFLFSLLFSFSSQVHASVGDWDQKGFTLSLIDQSNEQIDKSLEDLAATGANYVTISPGWLTDNKYSSNVVRKSRTPSDYKVRYTIRKAKSLGMNVMIKPHLDRKDGGWRAFIDPSNSYEFFKNYSNMMLLYADIAQQEGADQLSVGAELYKLSTKSSNEKYWREMIAKIRTRFDGTLTYSANSDSEYFDEGSLPFWDALDYWGSSMYISVAKNNNPTKEEILQEWKWAEDRYYKPMYEKIGLPLLATEIGYRSVDGAAQNPERFENNPPLDLAEQKLLYQMFFEYWGNKPYFEGVHFWFWEAGDNVGGTSDKDYTVQGKPAEAVVTENFSKTSSGSSSSSTSGSTSGSSSSGSTSTSGSSSSGSSTPTVPSLIPGSRYFTQAKVVDGTDYTAARFVPGAQVYIDRDYKLSSMPDFINGSDHLLGKNSKKTGTSSAHLTVSLNQKVDLYIAYDSRADSIPDWLGSWEDTGYLVSSTDADYMLYRKGGVDGTLEIGGNMSSGASGAQSNYILIASKGSYPGKNPTPVDTSSSTSSSTGSESESGSSSGSEGSSSSSSSSSSSTETSTSANEGSSSGSEAPSIVGEIYIKDPDDGDKLSGEEKLKFEIGNIDAKTYHGYFDVSGDGLGRYEMDSSGDNKQIVVDTSKWRWNGYGPYTITFIAEDLNGNLVDTASIVVYTKD